MLIFQNDGVLPIEGFTTFGMSAKPGSTNPIGKFGTGLKNAVAITLRLGGTFRVWRGLEEYVFYTKDEEFRGQTFARVRMKKRKGLLARWKYETLPFTTQLGKHWEPWMAFRELEANTRDEENGTTTSVGTDGPLQYLPREATTLIAIECDEIEQAFADIDTIFLPEREPIFENDNVRIYDGASKHVFYRGMRVTDLRKPSLFTYEMKYVQLTEDRTSMYSFIDDSNMKKALLAWPDRDVIDKVVRESKDHHEESFDWDEKAPEVSHAWHGALGVSGLSPRFSTMRDNLQFGLAATEAVSIKMTVGEWEEVLICLLDAGQESVYSNLRKQMLKAGWKDQPDNRSVLPPQEVVDAILKDLPDDEIPF